MIVNQKTEETYPGYWYVRKLDSIVHGVLTGVDTLQLARTIPTDQRLKEVNLRHSSKERGTAHKS